MPKVQNQAEASWRYSAAGGVGEGLVAGGVATAGVVLSPILVAVAIAWSTGGALHDKSSMEAQKQIELHMDATEVSRLLGRPSAAFYIEPAHTGVRYYARSMSHMSLALWIGLDSGRVIWPRFGYPDPWLERVTRRVKKAGAAPRRGRGSPHAKVFD